MSAHLPAPAQVLLSMIICWGSAIADVYLNNPRGSNNKLSEEANNRANNNRLFDSQNNARGGYQIGDNCKPLCQAKNGAYDPTVKGAMQGAMTYYQGSELYIEWLAQHGCGAGHPNVRCQFILQYMSDKDNGGIRDGTKRGAQNTAGGEQEPPTKEAAEKEELGQNEPLDYYLACKDRERNKGLYTADQNVRNDRGATATRQNPNGNNNAQDRSGLECPEERDYYPYWHPSPWHDIAVFTDEPQSRCDYYRSESQNVKAKGICSESAFNTPKTCDAGGGVWRDEGAFNEPPPHCVGGQKSRDNHNGNIRNGRPMYYVWTIPDYISGRVVLRLRYNITTMDFEKDAMATTHGVATEEHAVEDPFFVDQRFNDRNPGNRRRAIFTGGPPILADNPRADWIGLDTSGKSRVLQLQVNTNQVARTFQDRTHTFFVKERPDGISRSARIVNYNVRGRRGNIVQVYPSVEYDFVPQELTVEEGTYLHFQWTGSDANQANNEGNGRDRTDRSNLVQVSVRGENVPLPLTRQTLFFNGAEDPDNADGRARVDRFAYLDQDSMVTCNPEENNENAETNCKQLNGASAYFDGGLVKMTEVGSHHVASTRNNDFSNRSHKATIHVLRGSVKWYTILGAILGACLLLAMVAYLGAAVYAFKRPTSWLFSKQYRPRILYVERLVKPETLKAKIAERKAFMQEQRKQWVELHEGPSADAKPEINVGARVEVLVAPKGQGVVRFVGTTEFSTGLWVGVELPTPVGKNDGSVKGVRYFNCPPNCGIFAQPDKLKLLPEDAGKKAEGAKKGGAAKKDDAAGETAALGADASDQLIDLSKPWAETGGWRSTCLRRSRTVGLSEQRLVVSSFAALNAAVFVIGFCSHLYGGFQGSLAYPLAKGSGYTLDLNFAVLVLPTLKSLQTALRSAGATREWIPIDDPISFHIAVAGFIFLGTVIHVAAHVVHMNQVADAPRLQQDPLSLWDLSDEEQNSGATVREQLVDLRTRAAGITGIILVVFMGVLYITAQSCCRRGGNALSRLLGGYNLFWFIHRSYKWIYVLLLLHCPTRLWIWLLFPAFLVAMDRMLLANRQRPYAALRQAKSLARDVLNLTFDVPAGFTYEAGQYVLLGWRGEWHPFTLTSAPEERKLTLHIRAPKTLDWCYALRQRLLVEAPAASSAGSESEASGPKERACVEYVTQHLVQSPILYSTPKPEPRPAESGKADGKTGKTVTRRAQPSPDLERAASLGSFESFSELRQLPDDAVVLQLSGPFGAPAQKVWQFDTIMAVGSGIGVTPFASILRSVQLKQKQRQALIGGSSSSSATPSSKKAVTKVLGEVTDVSQLVEDIITVPKRIYFFWIVRNQEELDWFSDLLAAACEGPARDNIFVSVFVTGEIELTQIKKLPFVQQQFFGRPSWGRIFKQKKEEHKGEHIGVFLCGNPAVGKELNEQSVNNTDPPGQPDATRFSFFKEHF